MKKMENSKKHVLFRQKSKKLATKQLKQKKTKKRNNFTEKLDSDIKEKKSGSILTKSNNGGDKKKLRLLQKAGALRNIEQEKSKKEKLKNLLSHDLDHLLTEKNSLRAKISERSKIIHKILKNYPRQTAIIHKISEFFFIIFLNREIFSRYFIEKIDEKNNKATQNISYTKFLSKESIFSKLFNYLDPVNFTRILDQGIFFSFIYAYICLGLFINLIFWKKEILNKILLRSKKKKINSNGGLFIKFLSNLLAVYRLIFFVINMIFMNSFSCHQITVRKIIKPGDIYFDVMVDQNTDVEYLNGAFTAVASDEIKILDVEQISPYVNNGVVCGTTKYNFLIFFSVVIILLNFSLFLISWMISRSKPRISIRQSTKGIFDFVFQIGLNVLLFLKIFIKMKELDIEIIQDYYLYSSLTMIVMYCWALFSKPYYSRHFRGYQNFKMIYFGLISALSFIHLKFENFFFAGEKSMIILFLISLSILERLDRNLRSVDLKKICIEVKDNHQVKETTILYLYYKITKFISLKIKEFDKEKSNSKEIEKLLFLIISLKDIHKKSCRYTSCFCKRDHLFNENNSLMLSKKLQNKENFLLEAVMLLNELFEKYFRINIRQPKNEIFLCYVDFLINIFGKPSLAYKVILDQRRKNLRNSTKNRNKHYVETYLGVSLLDLDELMVENLSNGTMAFRIYNNYFNNEKDFDLQEEEEKFRFLDSILFLDQLEIMKKDIRNALWLKNDFVKEMERPSIQLSKICEISQKFCLMKESSKHKFFELKKIAGNNYSPIYCIYANFMIDICEDRKEGAKALMRYERISRNTNINKVLKIKKLLDNECVVMKVEFDEKIQRFVYVTSNFQKVLGK